MKNKAYWVLGIAWGILLLSLGGGITWLSLSSQESDTFQIVLALPAPVTLEQLAAVEKKTAPVQQVAQAPKQEEKVPEVKPVVEKPIESEKPAEPPKLAQPEQPRDPPAKGWQQFAQSVKLDQRPSISLILMGLGRDKELAQTAINALPGAVTLAFVPYTADLPSALVLAREKGHEVLLTLSMEPLQYPKSDPGPYTLLVGITPQENLKRLQWVLTRGQGYVGLVNFMGSRFLASEKDLAPILHYLKQQNLIFLENQVSLRSSAATLAKGLDLPYLHNDIVLDQEPSALAIDEKLKEVEQKAQKYGSAIAIGYAYPITVERIAQWAQGLDSTKVRLVPLTALLEAPQQQNFSKPYTNSQK